MKSSLWHVNLRALTNLWIKELKLNNEYEDMKLQTFSLFTSTSGYSQCPSKWTKAVHSWPSHPYVRLCQTLQNQKRANLQIVWRSTRTWFTKAGVENFQCPAQSSDLNRQTPLCGNNWNADHMPGFLTQHQLTATPVAAWKQIPTEMLYYLAEKGGAHYNSK